MTAKLNAEFNEKLKQNNGIMTDYISNIVHDFKSHQTIWITCTI